MGKRLEGEQLQFARRSRAPSSRQPACISRRKKRRGVSPGLGQSPRRSGSRDLAPMRLEWGYLETASQQEAFPVTKAYEGHAFDFISAISRRGITFSQHRHHPEWHPLGSTI